MKKIKINFSDFWFGFNIYDNFFYKLLSKNFNVEISDKPDYLIHSIFGKSYLRYNCIRICFTGENTRPDFKKSDFHIGFDYIKNNHYFRWPYFLLCGSPYELLKEKDIKKIAEEKTKFCNMVVSNKDAQKRITFFQKLCDYKQVDSGGRILNNIGGAVKDKLDFIKDYKFSLAFENSSFPGYTTEKIYEAMLQNSIPIYWGNKLIDRDFNTKSFININDFSYIDDAIEFIKKVDQDDELYYRILKEPYFKDNKVPDKFKVEELLTFFEFVFSQKNKIRYVAKPTQKYIYFFDKSKEEAYNLARKVKKYITY